MWARLDGVEWNAETLKAQRSGGWEGDATHGISGRFLGAAIEVHRVIGAGFAEIVYERALCLELAARGIAFERQAMVRVDYKGHFVGEGWMDLLVERELIVELKAVPALLPRHAAQVLAYLKATHLRVGLLVNFVAPSLQIKRFIQSAPSPPSP